MSYPMQLYVMSMLVVVLWIAGVFYLHRHHPRAILPAGFAGLILLCLAPRAVIFFESGDGDVLWEALFLTLLVPMVLYAIVGFSWLLGREPADDE